MPARLLPALLAVLIAATPVSATGVPEFYQVDLAPGTDNSHAFDSSDATVLDGWAYFKATDATHGYELWRAKGSSDGLDLEMVKDIKAGGDSSYPDDLVAIGDYVYFSAATSDHGYELWRTDGTAAGTALIKDIYGGVNSSNPVDFVDQGDWILFSATDETHGSELWRTDGTEAGTTLVKDINSNGGNSSYPGDLVVAGGYVYFTADDGINGREIWRSDGTAAGTMLWGNISALGDSNPQDLTVLNGVVYFSADDDVHARELWYANGATTDIVKDIYPGGDTSSSMNFMLFGSYLYFRAVDPTSGEELWRTDGTEAGTTLVKNINPTGNSNLWGFYPHDGYLYFSANDGTTGVELWRTDGTEAGTQLVENLADGDDSSSPDTGVSLGDFLYFSAYDQVNDARYVYRTSGSSVERVPFNLDPAQYINCDCYSSNIFAVGATLFSTSYSTTYGYEFSYLIEPTADLPSTNREGEQGTITLVVLAALTAAAGLVARRVGNRRSAKLKH